MDKKLEKEVTATYRGDDYLVRNNGAVCRVQKEGKRKRPLDNKWTLGTLCKKSGYMKLSQSPIHQIIATAYHGRKPSPEHVVDHIDTNRLNNRPENLKWVTRDENIRGNPKTLKRVLNKWGSVEALYNAPNTAAKADPISNRSWMPIEETYSQTDTVNSLTPLAVQRNWRTPCDFPKCPEKITDNPLYDYGTNLWCGCVFSQNDYGENYVDTYELKDDHGSLSIICHKPNEVKEWAVAEVTFEDGKFVHISHGTFFDFEGARKEHYQILGRSWDGGETFDDYC